MNIKNIQHMGAYYQCNCHCGEIQDNIGNDNIKFFDLKELPGTRNRKFYRLASKAKLLLNWFKLHQHCGVCGGETYKKDSYTERALVCSDCGNTIWPKTSPAIIVAITKGDKLLLTRSRQFPNRVYSCVAGFVEYGETFEECVKREVYEEVGIKVQNIQYFGSQPWPFPDSMMIGFTAEHSEGELEIDGEEISYAAWLSKEEVEKMHSKSISINSQLLQWFLEKNN